MDPFPKSNGEPALTNGFPFFVFLLPGFDSYRLGTILSNRRIQRQTPKPQIPKPQTPNLCYQTFTLQHHNLKSETPSKLQP